MHRTRSTLLALAIGLAPAACADDAAPPAEQHEPHDHPDDTCAEEAAHDHPSLVEFSVGLERAGVDGLSVTLLEADPAPPVIGDNSWKLLVKMDGEPVEGATLSILPWMTDHQHASTARTLVTDEGGGNYRAAPINFRMPGFFDVKITVQAGEKEDFVNFGFCLE